MELKINIKNLVLKYPKISVLLYIYINNIWSKKALFLNYNYPIKMGRQIYPIEMF